MSFSKVIFLTTSFCLFFNQDVTAKEQLSQLKYVDEPAGCLSAKKYPCALRALQQMKIEFAKSSIYLKESSSLVLAKEDEIRLLEGEVFVEGKEGALLNLGVVQVRVDGDVLIEKTSEPLVTVHNFLGKVQVFSDFQVSLKEEIPAGTAKWYRGLRDKKEISQGVFSAIDVKAALPQWRRLTYFPKAEAVDKLDKYKKSWKEGIDLTSTLYEQVVKMRLAQQKVRQYQTELRKEAIEEERRKLKELYRQKNYLHFFNH